LFVYIKKHKIKSKRIKNGERPGSLMMFFFGLHGAPSEISTVFFSSLSIKKRCPEIWGDLKKWGEGGERNDSK